LGRGVLAFGGNAAMLSGLYAVVPELFPGPSKRPHPGRRIKAVAGEWVASTAVALTRPFGHLGLPVGVRRPGGRPVIMVHGYAMSRANFLLLARRLHSDGLGPFFGFEYWTLARLEHSARRLARYVERVRLATGHDQVDIIGHSLGGLVARYYVALEGGTEAVRNLITIGSPHSGTHTSKFGFGPVSRQMRPGSPTLTRLASVPPPACPVLSVWSRSDAMVVPAASARLTWADEVVFEDLGHLSMLASRRVARLVSERLRGRF
jgi:pimeloyl-ACP methyl ester carboxylesterase